MGSRCLRCAIGRLAVTEVLYTPGESEVSGFSRDD
jgi:hypothetical protein